MQTGLAILIVIALAAVVVILGLGFWNMFRGGPGNLSQKLMRARVLVQFIAIVLLMIAVALLRPRVEEHGMVKLNKIYTRTGDDGTTGLVSGPRRPKNDLRVEAFGTVDEVNAFIGAARLHTKGMPRIDWVLARVQNDLFDLGGDLANPPQTAADGPQLRITATQVTWIEAQIDTFNADLEPLTSFVLPGGTALAAGLHLARVVARRAERLVVSLKAAEPETGEPALSYLNRLSDLLFVLARSANRNGAGDVLWKPGANTGEQAPA